MFPLPSVPRVLFRPEVEVPKVDVDALCGENMLLLPKSPLLKDSMVPVPPRILWLPPSPKPKLPLSLMPMCHVNLQEYLGTYKKFNIRTMNNYSKYTGKSMYMNIHAHT